MKKFDTKVQHIKYKVLREVARQAWDGTLGRDSLVDIPKKLIPGRTPTMRCCVYKERAILSERVKLAVGGKKDNPNVIEVIDIACDECPSAGYEVTSSCRGCLAHRCAEVCKRGAISFDSNHVAHIDKSKCVECGACARVCPFTAIINRRRPCQNACEIGAISINESEAFASAKIDPDKCISCGACVYQCPFGAISDKSYILRVVDLLKRRKNNEDFTLVAVVAPAISSQFTYAKLGQVITGLRKLGFDKVVEAALGADMVAKKEAKELARKKFLTSSCCPAFVSYIRSTFKDLVPYISDNLSPMATVGKGIKNKIANAKVVFIGPCTAKKVEARLESVREYVDVAMTFEELQALFDSRDIDITSLEESILDGASYYGRIFARCGGLAEAVKESLKEQNITDFELSPISCDGIQECHKILLKKSKDVLKENFVEGMACSGGCIGGAGCLTHGAKNRIKIEQYGKEASSQSIVGTVKKFSS